MMRLKASFCRFTLGVRVPAIVFLASVCGGTALAASTAPDTTAEQRVNEQLQDLANITGQPWPFKKGTMITREQVARMRIRAKFRDLDTDNNKILDEKEFKGEFKYGYRDSDTGAEVDQARIEFDRLAGGDRSLSLEEFEQGRTKAAKVANLTDRLEAIGEGFFDAQIGNAENQFQSNTIENVRRALRNLEQTGERVRKAEEPLKAPAFVPSVGLVLRGDPNKIKKDDTESGLILRVIKKFEDVGASASAATLSIEKAAGEKRDVGINGALRLELRKKQWLQNVNRNISPIVGIEVERAGTGDDRTDVRRYYAQAEIFVTHSNTETQNDRRLRENNTRSTSRRRFLESSYFFVGPVYETDLKNDVNRLIGVIEWEPRLNFGRLPTGTWLPLSPPGRSIEFLLLPRLGLELGDITKKPSGSDKIDANFAKLRLTTGLRLFNQRFKLLYDREYFHSLNGGNGNHTYQEWILNYALDEDKIYSLQASYKRGEDSPSFDRTQRYTIGFGIKY